MSNQPAPTWPGLPMSMTLQTGPNGLRCDAMFDINNPPTPETMFLMKLQVQAVQMAVEQPGVRRSGIVVMAVWEMDSPPPSDPLEVA